MAEVTITPTGSPAWSRKAKIGHYGGSLDKEDSETEGEVPYSWVWYQEIRDMMGDAFRQEQDGLVHAQRLALARSESARTRSAEKLATNGIPATAGERLGYWVEVLRVPIRPEETNHEIRQRAAAKFKAARGPTLAREDEVIEDTVGAARLKGVFRQIGVDLDSPPPQTFWPTENPGPTSHDLGDGAWLSERSHLVVSIEQTADLDDQTFLFLRNVQLFDLLDRLLPIWATFDIALDAELGFELDIDRMDFNALT